MKKILLVASTLLLFIPQIARSQTHPCDGTPTPNPTVTGSGKVGFCWNGKLTDGTVAVPTNFKVYVGTSITAIYTGLTPAIGMANNAGLNYYETASINFVTGSNSIRVTVTTTVGGESVASVPFTFTVVIPRTTAPTIIQIVK